MIAADNIVVTDYVPTPGMMFESGIAGNVAAGWMDVAGNPTTTLSVANGDLPMGGLAPGEEVFVDIYLTIDAPLPAGATLDNFAEISDVNRRVR